METLVTQAIVESLDIQVMMVSLVQVEPLEDLDSQGTQDKKVTSKEALDIADSLVTLDRILDHKANQVTVVIQDSQEGQ